MVTVVIKREDAGGICEGKSLQFEATKVCEENKDLLQCNVGDHEYVYIPFENVYYCHKP